MTSDKLWKRWWNKRADKRKDVGSVCRKSVHPYLPGESEATGGFYEIVAPVPGDVYALEDVPDETFSQGILGDGAAILPAEDYISAPAAGTINYVAATGHVMGLLLDNGIQVLIHVGINTVQLDGKYFHVLAEMGERVTPGTPILRFDRGEILRKGYSLMTPVIVTHEDRELEVRAVSQRNVARGEKFLKVTVISK
ncbi:PTS system, glucose subfamily, IIA component [Lachnospiraceae bacterium NK3A20]|nr:PTS system, glucose subfamily, IIA component [Lachnospiraceae bacterium NK3A20]